MVVAPFAAARAYAAVQAQTQALNQAAGAGAAEGAQGPGFGEMLKGVLNDAIDSSRKAESLMSAQVQGKANLVDVVMAVSSAETNLQTVMAIRDQVIAAYQQVMQMQI
ncbi:MAG TPA: flagellar hook-basal body complex protein FliE [Caulobacteraceae bacterium]|nr:flagellar hook-basal body complex protein FliE [Caulobacteraceae bacterium]